MVVCIVVFREIASVDEISFSAAVVMIVELQPVNIIIGKRDSPLHRPVTGIQYETFHC